MAIFISCDWGTSNLRLRLVDANTKKALSEVETAEGIASVFRAWKEAGADTDRKIFYLSILKKHIIGWLDQNQDLPILISGMASSSIGLLEVGYAYLPVHTDGRDFVTQKIIVPEVFENPVYLISGVRSENDVMRGEETLLAGCASAYGSSALFIFPGTHSKQITVKDGTAQKLATYMTGEFFDLLSRHSILAASVEPNQDTDMAFFKKGVLDGVTTNLLNAAFRGRTNTLFGISSPKQNYHYLSGLLIGTEVTEISGQQFELICIVANDNMIMKYSDAINTIGYSGVLQGVNAAEAMLSGHVAMYSRLHK